MKYWSRYPVFRFLIPFGAGILTNIYAEILPLTVLVTGIVFYLISFLFTTKNWATGRYAHRWLTGIPFYILFYCLGIALAWMHTSSNHNSHFSELKPKDFVVVKIKTVPAKTFSGWRFEAEVKSVRSPDGWLPARGRLLMNFKSDDSLSPFAIGDLLVTSAAPVLIKPPSNPGEFDYAFHMSMKGIYHRCYTDSNSVLVLEESEGLSITGLAVNTRNQLLGILKNRIPDQKELGVAGALLLGYEEWLDPEVENDYAMSGVLHILCVSGMHVGLLYMILGWIFSPMNKIRWLRHLKFLMFILIIWFYSLVTGFAPSIVRAATMFTFVLAGQWLERPNGIYNTLCASCFFMFLFEPFMIMAPGFQLSFLAVLGIVVLQQPLLYLYQPVSWLVFKIWELAAVSIAAQIATAPLSIYLFHQFPNYFLPANIIAVPLTTLGMYIGLLLFAVDWFNPVAAFIGNILSWLIQLVNEVIAFFGKLPGAITEGIGLSVHEMILLYLIIVLIFFWLTKKSFQYLLSGLLMMMVYLTMRISATAVHQNTNQLTVHHAKGSEVISIIDNRSALMITDSAFQDLHFSFSVEGSFIENGVEQIKNIQTQKGQLYSFSNNKIAYINNFTSSDSINLPKPQVLILGGKCHPALEQLIYIIKPQTVVFGSTFRMWKGEELPERLMSIGIKVHQVKTDGAFIMEVPSTDKILK